MMCLRKVFLYIHLSSGSTILLDSSMLYTKFGKLWLLFLQIFLCLFLTIPSMIAKNCILDYFTVLLVLLIFLQSFFFLFFAKGHFYWGTRSAAVGFFFFLTISTIFQTTQQKLYSNCAFRSKTTFLFVLIIFVSIISMGYILALGRLPTCLFTCLYFLLILQTCFLLILLPFKIAALKSLIHSNLG